MSFKNCRIAGRDTSPEKYHAPQTVERGDPRFVISPSSLRAGGECWRRWKDGYTAPDTGPKRWGSMLDCLALTPKEFWRRYALQPAKYETKGMECPNCKSVTESKKCSACKCDRVEVTVEKEWTNQSHTCQKWVAEHAERGIEVVTQAECDEVMAAVKRLDADPILKSLLDCSDRQVWVVGEWHDKPTGLKIPVQCLIDLAPWKESEFSGSLADLKSTRNAAPDKWQRWSSERGYHVQAAFDLDLWNAAEGEERGQWLFAVQENYPPFQTARRMLSEDKLALGRQIYQRLLGEYAKAVKSGIWPDYDTNIHPALRGWQIDNLNPWDERQELVKIPTLVVPPDPYEAMELSAH